MFHTATGNGIKLREHLILFYWTDWTETKMKIFILLLAILGVTLAGPMPPEAFKTAKPKLGVPPQAPEGKWSDIILK